MKYLMTPSYLGYIALVAMFLSVGIKINRTVPPKVLVDWEGILRPTPRDFIDTVKVRASACKNNRSSLIFPFLALVVRCTWEAQSGRVWRHAFDARDIPHTETRYYGHEHPLRLISSKDQADIAN